MTTNVSILLNIISIMLITNMLRLLILVSCFMGALSLQYTVKVVQRDTEPLISYLVQNNSEPKQVFNPTWIAPSQGTSSRKGLLIRTQNCEYFNNDTCVFCGGAASKASLISYSIDLGNKFSPVTHKNVSFTPSSFADGWGT
jgi:hypothetical protein